MIPFSGLSQFSGHFGGDRPSPLNRDTTVFEGDGNQTRKSTHLKFDMSKQA